MISPIDVTPAEVDASAYLEEILGDLVARRQDGGIGEGPLRTVELIGPHLRLAGTIGTGYFRRLSDYINNQDGLFRVRDATVLRRNGDATRVSMPDVWIAPGEVTLIAQPEDDRPAGAGPEFAIAKVAVGMIVVTPGHTLTGHVYIPRDAQLPVFIESGDPRFIPMTDVRTRSLADRRVIARYPFALLNRRHIVAASPLPDDLHPTGRHVL